MSSKNLGVADYKAYRLAGITILIAKGEFSNIGEKADFEQLPIKIFPPVFGFFIVRQDIVLPAIVPFVYEERIIYPKSQRFIRIQDAKGYHDIEIAEVVVPDFDILPTDQSSLQYCVFRGIGIIPYMIAKCDAPVLPGYEKVFGPDTYEKCQEYCRKFA